MKRGMTIALLIAAMGSVPASAGGYMSYGLGYNGYDDWGYPYRDDPYSWGAHHYYGGHHYGYGYPGVSLGYSSHGGDAGSLLAGLLLGGLLVHALTRSVTDTHDRPTASDQTSAVPMPMYPGSVIESGAAATRVVESVSPECVMTREYSGMITIDGEQRRAYGTRCMKPDGSWEYGPLRAEPEF